MDSQVCEVMAATLVFAGCVGDVVLHFEGRWQAGARRVWARLRWTWVPWADDVRLVAVECCCSSSLACLPRSVRESEKGVQEESR